MQRMHPRNCEKPQITVSALSDGRCRTRSLPLSPFRGDPCTTLFDDHLQSMRHGLTGNTGKGAFDSFIFYLRNLIGPTYALQFMEELALLL